MKRDNWTGTIIRSGHIEIQINGVTKGAHVWAVERVLGKSLPEKAVVHHVDGNPQNNRLSNLVVCPDESYHQLLHQRQRAFDACGNPNYRRCRFCKKWDDIGNLVTYRDGSQYRRHHRDCDNARSCEQYRKRRLKKEEVCHGW